MIQVRVLYCVVHSTKQTTAGLYEKLHNDCHQVPQSPLPLPLNVDAIHGFDESSRNPWRLTNHRASAPSTLGELYSALHNLATPPSKTPGSPGDVSDSW